MIAGKRNQGENPDCKNQQTSHFKTDIFSVYHLLYVTRLGMSQKVLSFDLGGTKIAAGIVTSQGKVLEKIQVPAKISEGKAAFLKQILAVGKELLKKHPQVKKIGIATAGPVDVARGRLIDPTNFITDGKTWGVISLSQVVQKALKRPVTLENDAAAAALAEKWLGAAKKVPNAMVLTLGTGLGTGILCNGELVRAGNGMHPEAGHLILKAGDLSAICGCRNAGCAEAYLSGKNFAKRYAASNGIGSITGQEIADLAKKKDPKALAAFSEYSYWMAVAIYNYVRIYNPDLIIFTGGFAQAFDLFILDTRENLKKLLNMDLPRLEVSKLQGQAGILGGAYVALK